MNPDDPAVRAAQGLTEAISGFTGRLEAAEVREKRLTFWLAAAGVAIGLLVAGAVVLALRIGQVNADRIAAERAQIQQEAVAQNRACLSTNRIRTGDLADKEHLYALLAGSGALTRAGAADMTARTRETDRLRDCAHLGSSQ